ncbi:MAG: rod shape-determining protein [Solirubrobacteraceae bacterium MAG38_C4-C5]|nr:rod shape-determining protein [Candidatus Siliceabacter maunaloa]
MLGGRDIAIDLGTANTLVYVRGEGVVLSEPSVVATDQRTGEVHAVGAEAERMIGRTPASISAIRPLRHGVIADFETTEEMLRYFIGKVHRSRFAHPRVVMCAPSGVTDVERRAVEEACLGAGARQMHLIEEPVAAAIGAGLDIAEPTGRLVVDVGGGTSEVAVISLGGIVVSESLRVGGYELTEAIATHVRRTHDVAIGEATAEAVKLDIGSAGPAVGGREGEAQVRGRHLASGLPVTVTLTAAEVRAALADSVQAIVDAVRATLEATPPELASDVINGGILLAGGGSLLQGFAERLSEETGIPAVLAESPLTCVVIGSGRSLEEFDTLARSDGGARRRRTWWR